MTFSTDVAAFSPDRSGPTGCISTTTTIEQARANAWRDASFYSDLGYRIAFSIRTICETCQGSGRRPHKRNRLAWVVCKTCKGAEPRVIESSDTICVGCQHGQTNPIPMPLTAYDVTHHDGTTDHGVLYCQDCADLAAIDWNGETFAIVPSA